MAQALLVSEQHLDQEACLSRPPGLDERDDSILQRALWDSLMPPSGRGPSYSSAFGISGMEYQRDTFQSRRLPARSNPIIRARHRNLVGDAHNALEQIGVMRKNRETQRQFEDESAWIAANRAKFAGKWVALLGNALLGVGDSAKDAYEAGTQSASTPLIVHIEEDNLPFAGW